MGLPEDHPLKEGELVSLDNLIEEVKLRLARKQQLDSLTQQAQGLKVADGIKGEEVKAAAETATPAEQTFHRKHLTASGSTNPDRQATQLNLDV